MKNPIHPFRPMIILAALVACSSSQREVLAAPAATPAPAAQAKPQSAPSFSMLPALTAPSALSMECQGQAPFETIQCDFRQLTVQRSDEPLTREFATIKKQIESMAPSKLQKEVIDPACKSQKSARDQAEAFGPGLAAAKRDSILSDAALVSELCDCSKSPNEKIKACILTIREKEATRKAHTCRVSGHSFALEFKQAGPRKWISNPGPKGPCNAVTVAVIEHEKEGDAKWSFSQTTVSADTDSASCKQIEINKPVVFSWKTPALNQMKCELVRF